MQDTLKYLALRKSPAPYSLCSQINKYILYVEYLYAQISICNIAISVQQEYQKNIQCL